MSMFIQPVCNFQQHIQKPKIEGWGGLDVF